MFREVLSNKFGKDTPLNQTQASNKENKLNPSENNCNLIDTHDVLKIHTELNMFKQLVDLFEQQLKLCRPINY